MQSHLEAALLGHGGGTNQTTVDECREHEQEETVEDVDEYIDEDCDEELTHRTGKFYPNNAAITKNVTLQMLLADNILQADKGAMCIEYLGQKFIGDLLDDGKIRSQETDIVFASPSAWAFACKRFINPIKKSGCGWASIKYKGKKLDAYKNLWYKKKKDELNNLLREEQSEDDIIMEPLSQPSLITTPQFTPRIVLKHNTIANRTFTHDANAMVECIPFSNLGKIQPFLISMSTNAALTLDFHCHLTKTEVSGYLGGQWDVNAHNLSITHAFPCRSTKADRENASLVEGEIAKTMEKLKLTLVGWYHSHPFLAASPTLRDVDAQLDYQIRMKGLTDTSYTPCIGLIISPYNYETTSLESSMTAYWVIPPPENKPNEYGRPMLMSYSVVQDSLFPQEAKEDLSKCVEYYKAQKDLVSFTEKFNNVTTYIDKLKSSLISKFPLDQNECNVWAFLRDILGCPPEEENVLTIPTIPKSTSILPTLNTPVSLSSNLMLSSDIANVLFNSGKFPSTSSLLGLPDPMAHSTLAANNMFLQTNLFKMQDLLKPLTTSSTTTVTSTKPKQKLEKIDMKSSPLKIPSDIKKMDFTDINLLSLKNKFEYANSNPELNLGEIPDPLKSYKEFCASDLAKTLAEQQKTGFGDYGQLPKMDFTVPDLNVPVVPPSITDFTLNLSIKSNEGDKSTDTSLGLDLSHVNS